MNNRGLIVLGLAVVCGLGAMIGVRKVLQGRPEGNVPKQKVLVAARPILVEETLTDDMMTVKEIPRDLVPAGSLTDLKSARGRWAKIPLLEGDLILDTKLAPKGTPTGLIGKITPGMRAIAIRVDEQTGISGFILPEYRVDVLRAGRKGQDQHARILVQNLRVLASGTVIESPENRSIQATTVTLEVTPAQAELITAAALEGPLALALRPIDEPIDLSLALETHPDPPAPEPQPAPPPVPVEPVVKIEPPPVVVSTEPPPPRSLMVFAGRRSAYRYLRAHEEATETESPDINPGGPVREGSLVRSPFQLDSAANRDAGVPPSTIAGIP